MPTNKQYNLTGATPSLLKNYLDPEWLLKKDWRIGTSVFGLTNEEDMKAVERMMTELNEKGFLERFMREHDRTARLGIFALYVCISISMVLIKIKVGNNQEIAHSERNLSPKNEVGKITWH